MRGYWLNRTLCDVLDAMRGCDKTKNYASLLGLVEEAQDMANRMESALGDKKDIPKMQDEWHKLKNELKELEKSKKELEVVVGKLPEEDDET